MTRAPRHEPPAAGAQRAGAAELMDESALIRARAIGRVPDIYSRHDLVWALRWLVWEYDRQALADA